MIGCFVVIANTVSDVILMWLDPERRVHTRVDQSGKKDTPKGGGIL